jgi:hypothetical protein
MHDNKSAVALGNFINWHIINFQILKNRNKKRLSIVAVTNHIMGELNWLLKAKPGSKVALEADFLGVSHNPRPPEN